jgi:hypothetical protein
MHQLFAPWSAEEAIGVVIESLVRETASTRETGRAKFTSPPSSPNPLFTVFTRLVDLKFERPVPL